MTTRNKIKLHNDTNTASTTTSTKQPAPAPQSPPGDLKKPAPQPPPRFQFKVTEAALQQQNNEWDFWWHDSNTSLSPSTPSSTNLDGTDEPPRPRFLRLKKQNGRWLPPWLLEELTPHQPAEPPPPWLLGFGV